MASPYRAPTPPHRPPPPAPDPLGPLFRRVESRGHSLAYRIGLGLVGVVGYGFLGLIALAIPSPGAWMAVVLGVLTALLAILAWPSPTLTVSLHEGGLVVGSPGQARTMAWSDVRWLYRDVVVVPRPLRKSTRTAGYRFVDQDGRVVRVPSGKLDAELGAWVERRVSTPLVAGARAALRDGNPLVFGDITVDREGITVGHERLSWSDVRDVEVHPSFVRVRRRDATSTWATLPIDKVPHPSVFVAVLGDRARIRG